jgi:hypothetical protein
MNERPDLPLAGLINSIESFTMQGEVALSGNLTRRASVAPLAYAITCSRATKWAN